MSKYWNIFQSFDKAYRLNKHEKMRSDYSERREAELLSEETAEHKNAYSPFSKCFFFVLHEHFVWKDAGWDKSVYSLAWESATSQGQLEKFCLKIKCILPCLASPSWKKSGDCINVWQIYL